MCLGLKAQDLTDLVLGPYDFPPFSDAIHTILAMYH